MPDDVDIAREEERERLVAETARDLTEAFARFSEEVRASPEDLWAISDWQGVIGPQLADAQRRGAMDPGHRRNNRIVSSPADTTSAWRMPDPRLTYMRSVARRLDRILVRSATILPHLDRFPDGLKVYRGIRNLDQHRFETIEGRDATYLAPCVLATSLDAAKAADFANMFSGATLPAVIELSIPPGHMALWLPPLGDPGLTDQYELLLPKGTRLEVTSACMADNGEWAHERHEQTLRALAAALDRPSDEKRRSLPRMRVQVGQDVR